MSGMLDEWGQLYDIESKFALRIAVLLIIGGGLGVFVRELYRRFSTSVSNRDDFSALFPLLTITTILVIAVVKSSLALSLGLVGALSIVRFRAAIKDPEELVYLFFCIAVGVSFGADLPLLGVIGVFIFTAFVVGARFSRGRSRRHNLLLTLTGDAAVFAGEGESAVHSVLAATVGAFEVQRMDLEGDQAQLRAIIRPSGAEGIIPAMRALQEKLPSCRVSYVNLNSLV